jgi:hypothetical protein
MPVVDLTRYIVASTGTWTDPAQDRNLFEFTRADTMSPERLLLRWAGDFVALTGPLRVRVTVQAENMTVPLALVGNLVPDAAGTLYSAQGGTATIHSGVALNEAAVGHVTTGRASGLQASTIYSYTLDVAAGQAWPFSLSEQLAALRLQNLRTSRFEQLGNNLGFRVIIEPAFIVPDCTPAAPASDLPCDFAVADHGNTARFFPAACEPCDGSVIGLPPSGYTALVTPPADGGVVRTRFFNGMFITREDLETEQRYMRMKSKLHNRAAGAGVVWGLRVGKQGSYLCVLPGYGVDCCGNDLTLTTTYKVDIAALMADPAAAPLLRYRGPHRMYLLLEYVECPSDPRPVHGDPCAPANRCEMSRIRESVRLRLVPPRDCDEPDSEPLKKFLDEVREVRKRYPLDPAAEMPTADRTPFQLRFTANRRTANPVTVRPSPQTTTVDLPTGRLTSLTVEVLPDPLWSFARGTLSAEARGPQGAPVPGIVQGPETIDLRFARGPKAATPMATFTLPTRAAAARDNVTLPTQLVFRIAGWQAQTALARQDDPAPSSDLTFTVNLTGDGHQNTLAAAPVAVAPLDLAARPCAGDPCTPRQRPVGRGDCGEPGEQATVDPTPALPWLHADPARASGSGDPKALMLAALGGWLTQTLAREREGTRDEVVSGRREVAQGIYRTAWLLLFGVPQQADARKVGGTLHRLLEAWCDELLWNGPQCCGDPHGVIIGCALVDGGTIQSIDPFGGRRYVIHYPLLEHWGAQFGLAPLDVTAMRIFSKLCCVASLPGLCVDRPEVPATVVAVGAGYVAVGEPRAIASQLAEKQIAVDGQRKVGTPEMIVSAINLLTSKPPAGDRARYTALVLGDFVAEQTVMLLEPA